MQSLGRAIASMSELRALECEEKDAGLLLSLLRHISQLQLLRSLKVSHKSFPPSLDDFQSVCVRHQKAIIDYTLCALGHVTENEVRVQNLVAIPKFVDALTTNYTVQMVALERRDLVDPDPWDSDCRGNIETLVRLNIAGRGRVAMDPNNTQESIDVLDQVSEDLDCIFIQLCENPLICEETPMPIRRRARSIATSKGKLSGATATIKCFASESGDARA